MFDLLATLLGFPEKQKHLSGGSDDRILETRNHISQRRLDKEFITDHDCGASVKSKTWKIHRHIDPQNPVWLYGFMASSSGAAKYQLSIAGNAVGVWFTNHHHLNLDIKFDRPIFVRPNHQITLTKLNQELGASQDMYSTLFYGDKAYPDFDELDKKHEQAN